VSVRVFNQLERGDRIVLPFDIGCGLFHSPILLPESAWLTPGTSSGMTLFYRLTFCRRASMPPKLANVKLGDAVAIFGAGALVYWPHMRARLRGAAEIYVVVGLRSAWNHRALLSVRAGRRRQRGQQRYFPRHEREQCYSRIAPVMPPKAAGGASACREVADLLQDRGSRAVALLGRTPICVLHRHGHPRLVLPQRL
jgi:hypothetical protein